MVSPSQEAATRKAQAFHWPLRGVELLAWYIYWVAAYHDRMGSRVIHADRSHDAYISLKNPILRRSQGCGDEPSISDSLFLRPKQSHGEGE